MPAARTRVRATAKARAAAGLALAAAVLLSAGCSINPDWKLARGDTPAPAVLLDVPFHPQTEYQCGPAALATVLGASGVTISPEALVPQVYLPGREGSLQLELVAATRRAGRIPYQIERDPDALLAEVRAGHPVLVLQNLLVRTVPKWHYAVVVGMAPAHNRVILNSGTERGLEVPAPKFLRTWDWADRWGLLALEPGELPARADAGRYLAAVADFEAVAGAEAATPAYAAALERWPHDPRVHLALGNQAYAAQQTRQAAGHYRRGLQLAPDDAVLGNNYASVLGELGCRAEAAAAIARALAGSGTDGRWREQLETTRAELAAQSGKRSKSCVEFRGTP
ncbi:PA2778 family cysteine peptidase [Novilysobacter arseniciresistens]|uniref:PA2778 family cysteine peptidase n=1 Tax=Novilysobacter arseniciresistens TaxID=1385522 RepID=UPI00068AAE47|nr:PA2778 family cysteine peptidase [Lysobacter arseniciresistens]